MFIINTVKEWLADMLDVAKQTVFAIPKLLVAGGRPRPKYLSSQKKRENASLYFYVIRNMAMRVEVNFTLQHSLYYAVYGAA